MRPKIGEWLLVLTLGGTMTVLNSWHVIWQWLAQPSERLFTGIAHYYADYFLYVSQMAQGASGAWFWANHQFTNEVLPPTWIYWFNLVLGRLGGFLGFSAFTTYNIALIFLVLTLTLLWYKVVSLLYPTDRARRLTAYLFILTASGFFNLTKFATSGILELTGQFWFSPTPAFNRLGGVPHQVLQTILILLCILFFTQSKKRFYLVGLSFLASSANPIQMLLLVLSAVIATFVFFRRSLIAFLAIPALVGAWLTNIEFARQPILLAAKGWELTQNVPVTLPQFLLSAGPVGILAPFGLWPFLKRKNPLGLLLFGYGVLSILVFFSPLPRFLGTNPVRWLAPAPYAILGILGAEGVAWLISNIKKPNARFFFYLLFIIFYLLFTFLSLAAQIDERANPKRNWVLTGDLNHVPRAVVEALTWLRLPPNVQSYLTPGVESGVVLTDPALPYDVLVPVLANKTSFTGHPLHTLYPQVKEALRQRFFTGEMSEAEALQFLSDHRIGYVMVAAKTRQIPPYSFLTPAFSNDAIIIYITGQFSTY